MSGAVGQVAGRPHAAPTNTDLAAAITDVLASCRHFRELYGKSTPEQQAIVMAAYPWPIRSLELRDLSGWAAIATSELLDGSARP